MVKFFLTSILYFSKRRRQHFIVQSSMKLLKTLVTLSTLYALVGCVAKVNDQAENKVPATIVFSQDGTLNGLVTKFNFGKVALGGSAEFTIDLFNTGDIDAKEISSSAIPSPFSYKGGSYPGTGGNCKDTLVAKGTCEIVLVYTPGALVVNTESFTLSYKSLEDIRSSTLYLEGTGATAAQLTISEAPLYDYGNRAVGGVHDHIFTVTNSGGQQLQTSLKVDFHYHSVLKMELILVREGLVRQMEPFLEIQVVPLSFLLSQQSLGFTQTPLSSTILME